MRTKRALKISSLSILSLLFTLAAAVPAGAIGGINVDSLTDDGTGCTLREAVETANNGVNTGGCISNEFPVGVIYVNLPGTITLQSPITVSQGLSLIGPRPVTTGEAKWPNALTVRPAGAHRAFIFNSPGDDQYFAMVHFILTGNEAGEGGGVFLYPGDILLINYSELRNCSSGAGGAIFNLGGYLNVHDSVISGNRATGNFGGGIYSTNHFIILQNCTFSGNVAAQRGGAAYIQDGAQIFMSTFSGNRAGDTGGALFLRNGTALIANSILWGDFAAVWPEIATDVVNLNVTYSDVMDVALHAVWPGTGNILADPLFINPRPSSEAPTAAGDYHLKRASPCVNAGTADWCLLPNDLDGDVRFQDAGPDLGSDEAGPPFNDSFEYGAVVPRPWRGVNLGAGDGRVMKVRHLGRSSFRITGGPEDKFLRQVLKVTGQAGDTITLGGWSKARGTSPAGGAFGLAARVIYDDGTSKFITTPFAKGNHRWRYQETFQTVDKAYVKVVFYLRFFNQTGTAWFDDVKLYIDRAP